MLVSAQSIPVWRILIALSLKSQKQQPGKKQREDLNLLSVQQYGFVLKKEVRDNLVFRLPSLYGNP